MPRTIRNQFDKKLSYESLYEAHKKCRKGKGYRKEVILFNQKQEEYILWLYESLKNGTYKHGDYKTFLIKEPKQRKIEASRYIDRIVHTWVVENFLKEYFCKTFIYHSYACIENKGAQRAALNVQKTMKHCKRIWGEYYVLKTDVAHYFQSIDKEILLNILTKKIKDPKLMYVINEIMWSQPQKVGIPIGNYTSQIFANIYLNEVDQWVKHELKCKYYFRYMDDSVFIFKTKKEAKETLKKLRAFLRENLKLELNNKTQIFKNKQGVNFCGYKINEYRLKIRDRGKKSLKKKVKKLKKGIKSGEINHKEAKVFLAGHLGYIDIANTKNLEDKIFGHSVFLESKKLKEKPKNKLVVKSYTISKCDNYAPIQYPIVYYNKNILFDF